MSLHQSAWAGIRLLVVGGKNTTSMRIEQGISASVPAQEILIDSFEFYIEALEHCRRERDIGFLIIHEKQENGLSALDVFRGLSAPFEAARGPCFGVLVREGEESVTGHATLRFAKGRLLDYVSESSFLDPGRSAETISSLWSSYIDAFEATIAPEAIKAAISELVATKIDLSMQRAYLRTCRLLSDRLSLSWWDALGVRWSLIMQSLKENNPQFHATQSALIRICETFDAGMDLDTPEKLSVSKAPLPIRLSGLLYLLSSAPTEASLAASLESIKKLAKPGASGLIRQVARAAEEIEKIHREERFTTEATLNSGGLRVA